MKLVVLGDSLSAGYLLAEAEALPARLERLLIARGHDVEVVNAGVSGDTATDGLARVDWSIGDDTDGVIVELGANDALRGIDPEVTRKALDAILSRLGERSIKVLLVGMRAPPNLGQEYGKAFDPIYAGLAAKHGAPLYPFALDGVFGEAALLLDDGIHPNAHGVIRMAERMLPAVERLVRSIEAGR